MKKQSERHPYVFGMPAVTVKPGETVTISEETSAHFFPGTLVIPLVIGKHFHVVDIKCNGVSQIKRSHKPMIMPATLFQPGGTPVNLKFDSVKICEKISLRVKNISKTPCTFRACFKGDVVLP